MNAKHLFTAPAIALAIAASLTFTAHPGHAGETDKKSGKHSERFLEKMTKELELSDAQVSAVKEILAEHKAEYKAERREGGDDAKRGKRRHHRGMMPLHGEFLTQLRAENVDTAALNSAFEGRSARMREHRAAHVRTFVELHAVLTPEQRAELADKMEERRAKMKKRMEKKQ